VTRNLASLSIGDFFAHVTVLICTDCRLLIKNEELEQVVSPHCKFGFDVIVYVGEALFVHHRSNSEIQQQLAEKNITISLRQIAYLGKKFITYLALCHQSSGAELKQYLLSNGGYILHLDGTCEGDSPHIMSCMDQLSHIVLDNIKVPSENARQLTPFLQGVKDVYGDPLAVMHDMSAAIINSVEAVFPGVKDFVCHFHFLRDIGKDLLGVEYNNIRKYLTEFKIRGLLRKAVRELKVYITQDSELHNSLKKYLKNKSLENITDVNLASPVVIYLLISWILESNQQSHGFGFPFDRTHLDFYCRLQEASTQIVALSDKLPLNSPKLPLTAINDVLSDRVLHEANIQIQAKVLVFDELRVAMRIALPASHLGLKDEGEPDIKTIEARVKAFRHADKIKALLPTDLGYRKMMKQIDKYWDKLFADPIEVETKDGLLLIQPQRTNNLMETFFRDLKHDWRKKFGTSTLSKTLKSMPANIALIKNLKVPQYMAIILAGKTDLAQRFADIDIELVRQELKQDEEDENKYLKGMAKLFRISNLPAKLAEVTQNKMEMPQSNQTLRS
jgi:hypothetical protein